MIVKSLTYVSYTHLSLKIIYILREQIKYFKQCYKLLFYNEIYGYCNYYNLAVQHDIFLLQ